MADTRQEAELSTPELSAHALHVRMQAYEKWVSNMSSSLTVHEPCSR
jgi:hypothetical protein